MAKLGTFSTVSFTFEGGFLVSDISGARSAAFDTFLDNLRAAGENPLQVYALRDIPSAVFYDLFSQLDDGPRYNGIKQVRLGDNADIVRNYIEPRDGFRDHWTISGDEGDRIKGTNGDDVVFAQGGGDHVKAGFGADFVDGGNGRDTIRGEAGDDILNGGASRDTLDGGSGNDILRGGTHGDQLTGGSGADTFLWGRGDFSQRGGADIVTDYSRAQGDQIVDETGKLKVVETGFIDEFGQSGTLLEHRVNGAQVFVQGVELRQGEIKQFYTPPEPPQPPEPPKPPKPPGPGEGIPQGDAELFLGPDRGAFDLRITRTGASFDGTNNVETYDVYIRNNSSTTITNLDQLNVGIKGGAGLDITSATGATYINGRFDVGGISVGADGETRLFTFNVLNRPAGLDITDRKLETFDFQPIGSDGRPVETQNGFKLTLNIVETHNGGASAEVFIKNVGPDRLVDLDGLEFGFDGPLGRVTSTWGADYFDKTFAVGPWQPDNPHGDLNPDERAKLFGFSFDTDRDFSVKDLSVHDFTLQSKFNDLLS